MREDHITPAIPNRKIGVYGAPSVIARPKQSLKLSHNHVRRMRCPRTPRNCGLRISPGHSSMVKVSPALEQSGLAGGGSAVLGALRFEEDVG